MDIELQQITVFENGIPTDQVWVAVIGSSVLDRPNHSRSLEATQKWAIEKYPEAKIRIHPDCQPKHKTSDKKNRKGRK
jgi:hypothetical protein